MGKTCVAAALILANKQKTTSSAADISELTSRAMSAAKGRSQSAFRRVDVGGKWYEKVGVASDMERPEPRMQEVKLSPVPGQVWDNSRGRYVKAGTDYKWTKVHGSSVPNSDYHNWTAPPHVKLGMTVVLTSNTLLGQWQASANAPPTPPDDV